MSLHDSPLADTAMRGVALQTICSAPSSAPVYAADLVQHAGAKPLQNARTCHETKAPFKVPINNLLSVWKQHGDSSLTIP